jgi:hypothetical protein
VAILTLADIIDFYLALPNGMGSVVAIVDFTLE